MKHGEAMMIPLCMYHFILVQVFAKHNHFIHSTNYDSDAHPSCFSFLGPVFWLPKDMIPGQSTMNAISLVLPVGIYL